MKNWFTSILILFFLLPIGALGQNDNEPIIHFTAPSYHPYGFDNEAILEWVSQYENSEHHPHILMQENQEGAVLFSIPATKIKDWQFRLDTTGTELYPKKVNDSTFTILLPAAKESYTIYALYKRELTEQLNVHVFPKQYVRLTVVPVGERDINISPIASYLDSVYAQANIQFKVRKTEPFITDSFDGLFHNPSIEHIRYTPQMHDFRDEYIRRFPNYDQESYYVFIVDGFVDSTIQAYMPLNKAIAFVKDTTSKHLAHVIGRELGHGIGMLKDSWDASGPAIGTTDNLMDITDQSHLAFWQWEWIQRSASSFSFFDEDEDLKTNNGMVAYYFWKEDKDGFIHFDPNKPLASIHRPYKKNYRSVHLNIEDYFFMGLFEVLGFIICTWHIIVLVILIILWFWLRRKIIRWTEKSAKLNRHYILPLLFTSSLIIGGVYYLSFHFINEQIKSYEIRSGHVLEFDNKNYALVKKAVLFNTNLKHENEEVLQSELLIQRDSSWYIKHRKNVLYFSITQDSLGNYTKAKFYHDSDSLIATTLNYRELAQSHYYVFTYKDSLGNNSHQRVYNHIGFDISEKLFITDASKRILLFVNGYRPTSLGANFEEYFTDIKANGFEYEESRNLIYDFDRYDYWQPWKQIDYLFTERINPAQTYYADGHFSVSTSNHGSLINFSANSVTYPERCKNPRKHICSKTMIKEGGWFEKDKWVETKSLLATKPNVEGFNYRREKGKVAGKNMLMMLNEFPNRAENDTLFIVAHSMGYAYSLGMIDELRGRINFGGFYIIAPENASSGEVYSSEWEEIWQYGVNPSTAACLQDGVAPQTKVDNLPDTLQVFIPSKNYKQMGYFESHFIGYFTWILDIPKGQPGTIRQR